MKLSVIIVNYNVKHFLEQALFAAQKACVNLHAEVFVVDNVSSDGSVEMLKQPQFNWVKTIFNTENLGFSRANNQAMRLAQGEFILLLNPDTLVAEDSFEQIIGFMEQQPACGGLGVYMIDGKGSFLPESKRGLPTPNVAFYKIFGLSKFFPRSKKFGKYHLSYLDKTQIHEIQVLSGAFMLMRKSVLDQIGLLDEKYFMYGEDIDLSYRISLAGYKNYYYPHTQIIHYKGESTKKDTLKYIITFYKAMVIFAKQYFTKSNAAIFGYLIHFAVIVRAAIALLSNWLKLIFSPLFDAALIYGGMLALTHFWQQNIKNTVYPAFFIQIILPFYIVLWLVSVYFSGGYDKPFTTQKMVRGILVGTVFIAALYGFLPENLRFSRGLILAGAALATALMLGIRLVLHLLQVGDSSISTPTQKTMIAVANTQELAKLMELLPQTQTNPIFLGFVSHEATDAQNPLYLGNDLEQAIAIFKPKEIVFCGGAVSNKTIVELMMALKNKNLSLKIMPERSQFIIGSHSVDAASDLYTPDFNLRLSQPSAMRNKRVVDLGLAFLLIVSYPFWGFNQKKTSLSALFQVVLAQKTMVGYAHLPDGAANTLPVLKPSIFSCFSLPQNAKKVSIYRANLLYAKYYSALSDVKTVCKAILSRPK